MNLNAILSISGEPIPTGGGASSWDEINDKPFSTVDTESGLTIQDDTLMIDTLDHIATIDYVDQQIADIPTPTVNIDNKSIINGQDGLQLNQPFGEWSDVIYGWKPDFEYNGSAWVHTLTQDEKNYCSNELIPDLLLGFRLPIFTWSFGNYGEYTDYTVTQDGTTVTISLDAYHSLEISADDMTATGFTPIDFTMLIQEGSVILEQYNIEAGEIGTEQRIHQIPKAYIPDPLWNDIQDKPTIPQADGTSIIDNNGIWSAVGGSGSVQIDNKSLVKVNDVIQEAVPIYSEQVTTTYGPGAKFTHFEYPSGNDLDTYAEYIPTLNQSQDYYNVYLSVNGVMYQGTWTAADNYGGWTLQMDIGSGVQGYEMYMTEDTSGVEPIGRIHIYLNGMLISGSGSIGNVDWLLIEPSEEDASFEHWARNVSRWGTVSNTETVYHKLPHEYYDGVQEVRGYYEPEGTVQDGKAIAISSSGGIRIDNYITEGGYKLRVINLDMNTKSLVGDGDGLRSLRGDAFTEKLNSSTLFHFSYDSNCDLFDCGEFGYWLGSGGYGFIIPVKGTYILIDDRNNTWSAKGYESLFDSVEIIPYADPETEYNGKYYSDGTSVVQFVHPKFSAQQGDGFEGLAYSSTFGYFDYAKLNAQFLPIDNNTIRINSNGNIYAVGGGGGGSTDWNDITNKPNFATVATSGSYNDLSNKPTIPTVPTNVSDFTNDAGYITSSDLSGYATESYVDSALEGYATESYVDSAVEHVDWDTVHNKPENLSDFNNDEGFITSSDLPQADGTSIIDNNGVWSAVGGGGTAPTPNWTAASGQDGYIANKPPIWVGTDLLGSSIVEGGSSNIADQYGAHAEGGGTWAHGVNSHAEGNGTEATGSGSHAEGDGTIANSSTQHVQGSFNIADPSSIIAIKGFYADIIGNGTADNYRSNAEATDWNGNKYLAGDVYTHVTDWTDPKNNSIKLANIPAPPTTDDTYTLQAVVTNGEVHYYWLGTPQ